MTSGERIKKIRGILDVTQGAFGAPIGFKWYKVKDIEAGKIKVSPEIATKIENEYSFRFEWILTGEGPMKKEDTLETVPLPAARAREAPAAEEMPAAGIKISTDLTMAARVLESNTPYALALHLNIRSFAKAVNAEEQLAVLELNQRDFEKKVNTEIAALRMEVNRLKATYEAPDGRDEDLTNLNEKAM